jgi:hypothetical protein
MVSQFLTFSHHRKKTLGNTMSKTPVGGQSAHFNPNARILTSDLAAINFCISIIALAASSFLSMVLFFSPADFCRGPPF